MGSSDAGFSEDVVHETELSFAGQRSAKSDASENVGRRARIRYVENLHTDVSPAIDIHDGPFRPLLLARYVSLK